MFEQLITGENLTLAGGVFVLLTTMKRMFPAFFKMPAGRRLLPVIPLVLGIAGAFLPGLLTGMHTWADRLTVGMIAGFAASHLFKVGKTTMLGHGTKDDDCDTDKKKPSKPVGGENG